MMHSIPYSCNASIRTRLSMVNFPGSVLLLRMVGKMIAWKVFTLDRTNYEKKVGGYIVHNDISKIFPNSLFFLMSLLLACI